MSCLPTDAGPFVSTAAIAFAPRYHRWPAVLASLGAIVLVLLSLFEAMGWPFLAEPMQRWLSGTLHRRVSFAIDGNTPASVAVRLFGRVRVEAPLIEIGPPSWSTTKHMLRATDAVISLHYDDLWRASRGEPLRIHMLEADEFDADIERIADGRASWHFGPMPPVSDRDAHSFQLPLFDELKVHGGTLRWRDAVSDMRMAVDCRAAEPVDDAATSAVSELAARGLECNARGTWHNEPVSIAFQSIRAMPWVNRDPNGERSALILTANFGDARVTMQGTAVDALGLSGLDARVEAEGRSVATLAQALDLRFTSRVSFHAVGTLKKGGAMTWYIVLDRLQLGTSELSGRFIVDRTPSVPLIAGRLEGLHLTWGDLAEPPERFASAKQSVDMPALRALDADLAVDIKEVDFGGTSPLQPLRGEWRLANGRVTWTPGHGPRK
jgi:AsmA family protein